VLYDDGDVEGGGNLGGHRENDAYLVLADRGVGRTHERGIDLGVRYIVESLAGILVDKRLYRRHANKVFRYRRAAVGL